VSAVAGGYQNTMNQWAATVAGGRLNDASGFSASISGGVGLSEAVPNGWA
jgi:hypothetical protein